MDSIIYEIYICKQKVFLIAEIDVYCLNVMNLDIEWHIPISDIVTGFEICEEKLIISTDIEKIVVELSTGGYKKDSDQNAKMRNKLPQKKRSQS